MNLRVCQRDGKPPVAQQLFQPIALFAGVIQGCGVRDGKFQRRRAAVEAQQRDIAADVPGRTQRVDGRQRVGGSPQSHVPNGEGTAFPGTCPFDEPRAADVDRLRLRRRTDHGMERLAVRQ